MNLSRDKILIVDDTPENIHVLMEVLREDYSIVAAKNGEKALQLAKADPRPDIILLDIMMPVMDGYEVCRRLKADAHTRDIPVVYITALSDAEDEAKGLALGAVDYIPKPFQPGLVKARVRNHLELKHHRDRLEELVRQRTHELALTREVTIECLANLTEFRDPETGGHIKRTQNYVRLLSSWVRTQTDYESRLNEDAIEMIYLSAPLHDVGKVAVPDAILFKAGPLTAEEWVEMKKHTIYGGDALTLAEKKLGGNSFLRYAKEIAYHHHEKWNGMGYPHGLAGEAIPLSARLMAVADVYDALISKRVYKPPFSHQESVDIIAKGREADFDPKVVDAFLALESDFRDIAHEFADSKEEQSMLSVM